MVRHRNNIGVLRLLFASLVIVSHAYEQIDGDRSREPLTRLFHTVSLGEVSVDGFFLISGLLITASLINTGSLRVYFERRIMRIWPGYIVACLLCSFLLAPLAGGHPLGAGLPAYVKMIFLRGPIDTPGQLAGLPYPVLNGAMWTISFEFACYAMIAVLGVLGVISRPRILSLLTFCALACSTLGLFSPVRGFIAGLTDPKAANLVFGDPMRLAAFFLVGALACVHQDRLSRWVTGRAAIVAAGIAVLSLASPYTAQIGLALAGGLALFWLAFKADIGRVQQLNDRWDISYGTYLYGWPIATALLYFGKLTSPLALIAVTWPLALLAGAASWHLVEKRTKDLFRARRA